MKAYGQTVLLEVLYAFESLRTLCPVLEANSCNSCHSTLTILKFARLFLLQQGSERKY